jgi:hypothetical protein
MWTPRKPRVYLHFLCSRAIMPIYFLLDCNALHMPIRPREEEFVLRNGKALFHRPSVLLGDLSRIGTANALIPATMVVVPSNSF